MRLVEHPTLGNLYYTHGRNKSNSEIVMSWPNIASNPDSSLQLRSHAILRFCLMRLQGPPLIHTSKGTSSAQVPAVIVRLVKLIYLILHVAVASEFMAGALGSTGNAYTVYGHRQSSRLRGWEKRVPSTPHSTPAGPTVCGCYRHV
jgi:hypothetical protein